MKKLSVLWAMLLLPAASLAQVGGPGTVVVGGGGSGGSGDVTGPSSSTDNAFVRFDSTTGKIIQTSNLTCSDVSGVTTTLATITPAATTGATVAGQSLAVTASPAVASTDTAGANDGGSITLTAGAAARNTSGNANGGDINLVTGAGIGTGTAGQVVVPGGTAAAPGIALSGATNTGIQLNAGALYVSIGGGSSVRLADDATRFVSTADVGWTSSTTDTAWTATDTGFKRNAAGVVKVTDGSTGIRGFLGGGAAVASATAMPVPTGRVFHVTGTTAITSITSTNFQSGSCITLIFDDVLTFTDGGNLELAGDFVTTNDDTIHLCYDGTLWFEEGRSIN